MGDRRRVILFSTETEGRRRTLEVLSAARFEISMVDETAKLMREVRNGRDRVVLLDFGSNDIDGLQLLREIKRLDGSIQVLVINAEPRLFLGVQVFRSGGEACIFKAASSDKDLCEALDGAFDKVARWWRALQSVATARSSAEEKSEPPNPPPSHDADHPGLEEEVEVVIAGWHSKGKIESSSPAGLDVLTPCSQPPALLDTVLLRHRGKHLWGIVRRFSKHPSGSLLLGLEWSQSAGVPSVAVGARADRALFVTLAGHHVVARSLVAESNDWVSARLANGQVHSVPTSAVCSLTRQEREAELHAADDLSFFVELYQLQSIFGLAAIAQAVMDLEFFRGEVVG
jgi:FixJ family two-component response regulator